jgi:hypothetical protein
VTKARHHRADKAIMVAANGFQKGAKEVALKEKIELYSLRQIEILPDDQLTDIFLSFIVVRPVGFLNKKDPAFSFSEDSNTFNYEVETVRMTGYGDKKISDLIYPFTQLVSPSPLPGVPEVEKVGFPFKRATDTPQQAAFALMENTELVLPDGAKVSVTDFLFYYWQATARLMDTGGIDPTIFTAYGKQYRNVLNNEVAFIDPADLPLGVNTVFEVGKFYTQPQLKFSYYCHSIENGEAAIYLVESFQHGLLVQGRMMTPLDQAKFYVEITDEKEIARLKELFDNTIAKNPEATIPQKE